MASNLQNKLLKKLKRCPCIARSLNQGPLDMRGMPDVEILFDSKVLFAEIKEPGDSLSPIQKIKISLLASFGFETVLVRTNADIEKVINIVRGE